MHNMLEITRSRCQAGIAGKDWKRRTTGWRRAIANGTKELCQSPPGWRDRWESRFGLTKL
jgi:hypothetical protein